MLAFGVGRKWWMLWCLWACLTLFRGPRARGSFPLDMQVKCLGKCVCVSGPCFALRRIRRLVGELRWSWKESWRQAERIGKGEKARSTSLQFEWSVGVSRPGWACWRSEGCRRRGRCVWHLCWTTSHSGSRRIGEAAHPGPTVEVSPAPLRWVQANVTGTCNLGCVLELPGDVFVISEPRCTGKVLAREAKTFGFASTGKKVEGELLGALVFDPRVGCELVPDLERWPQWKPRIAGAHVQLSSRQAAVVWAVYGKDQPKVAELAEFQEVLKALLAQARQFGNVPVLVAGDFNVVLSDCPLLVGLARDGWRDLGSAPTCITAASDRGRRIDLTMANRAFHDCVLGYETRWDVGLPTHAVQFWFTSRAVPEQVLAYSLGKGLGEEPVFDEDQWKAAWQDCQIPFWASVACGLVDVAWQHLEGALVKGYGREALPPRARLALQDPTPKTLYGGDADVLCLRLAAGRKRRLQQLLVLGRQPGREVQLDELWQKLQEDPEPAWAWWGLVRPGPEVLATLVQEARNQEDAARGLMRRKRQDSWHQWATASSKGSLKQLFRWVREGARQPEEFGIVRNPDGQVLAGEAALLQEVDKAWWPLWRPENDGRALPARFPRLGEGEMPILTVGVLKRASRECGLDKAPGEDGWTGRRIAEWPDEAWFALCGLLKAVEKWGRWPASLEGGLVCLLPKGGISPSVQEPLQARPVVLLSVIYRIWAKARSYFLEQWIVAAGAVPVEEAKAACEDLAVDLAFDLEAASSGGPALYAVATDLSKAYDRIPLEVLEVGLRDMGLPGSLWKPVVAMAKTPRRIKVRSACGKRAVPTHGLVPGCPLATFVMGLMLHRWRTTISLAVPGAVKRCWVDDSTASIRGSTLAGLKLVLANVVAFEGLAATDAMKVNHSKSGYITSCRKSGQAIDAVIRRRAEWATGGIVVIGEAGPEEPAWVAEAPLVLRAEHLDEEGAVLAAARASAIVVGLGCHLQPAAWEVALVSGCVVIPGGWQGADEALTLRVRQQLQHHGLLSRWVMAWRSSVKDLGLAQGCGKEARDMAAERQGALIQRAGAIAKLAVGVGRAEMLMSSSGIPAGLYGAGARPPDADTLACLRRWVVFACYKGSRFVQTALWFVFCARTWRSDPMKVWVIKAAEAVARQCAVHGLEAVQEVWAAKPRGGPVAGLKTLLTACGVEAEWNRWEAGGVTLQQPMRVDAAVRKDFLLRAVQVLDLRQASRRKGQLAIDSVDVLEARRLLALFPVQGQQEALRSVFAGDCVVRAMTRHWQGHDGMCACGGGMETRRHIFWECPRTVKFRLNFGYRAPSGVEGELGLPMRDPVVQGWVADWIAPGPEPLGEATAMHLYVDASALYPRLSKIRTVGWAVVAGEASERGGVLPPGTSVAWGEAWAIVEAYRQARQAAVIWSDCEGAVKVWARCLRPDAARYAGALQGLLPKLADCRKKNPTVQVQWVPSHLTLEEAKAKGIPEHVWRGNDKADRVAKARAMKAAAPHGVVKRIVEHQARAKEVAGVVAAVQLHRLKQRLRVDDGQAVKARKRQAPALPRRLRPKAAKRPCLRQAVGEGPSLIDLLMPAKRANVTAKQAAELLERDHAAVGFHDLWPLGPWPGEGLCEAKNGRLPWPWMCRSCNKGAGDSSRAVALARTPCAGGAWSAEGADHDVQAVGVDAYVCRRCGRKADAAHRAGMEVASCPVPCVRQGGVRWQEGELALARLMGRVMAFRRWAEPGPGVREPALPQDVPAVDLLAVDPERPRVAGLLEAYRGHVVGSLGRQVFCCACFEHPGAEGREAFRRSVCMGSRPVGSAPAFLVDGLRRGVATGCCGAARSRLAAIARLVGGRCGPPGRTVGSGPVAMQDVATSVIGRALFAAGAAGGRAPGGRETQGVPGFGIAGGVFEARG